MPTENQPDQPEVPVEVLHRIFRRLVERSREYPPDAYGSDQVRQQHIDSDASNYYAHPDGRLLLLVLDAIAEGRELAYNRDEWRSVYDSASGVLVWSQGHNREVELAWLKQCRDYAPDARFEHRRMAATDWSQAPEEGAPDA